MKESRIITLGLAVLMMTFTACQKDDEVTSDIDALELETDTAQEDTFESVDQIVEGGISSSETGIRMDEDPLIGLTVCVEVTHDSENKIITLDFGDGCADRHGNIRKGMIVIEYNYRAYISGAYRIVTFVDFHFNDINVQGTRTITNTSTVDAEMEFTVTLVDGKLDFGDGVFATRDASWIRTWFIGEGKVTVSGGAEGTNINGVEYSATVDASTPLLFLRDCGKRLPVSGIKEMVVGDRSATINYGDGECDRIIEVTVNGVTTIKEITPREGRRK
ncbi:MAG: hypothetical protein GY816_23935 [Cytophagales bacterium]|nr:hypothetical protein [Cytophagales bacterium]